MSRAYTSLPAILASDQGQFCPAASDQEDLLLELALSVWLKTSELGLEEARVTMLAVRRALLELAGFHRRSEPIPLVSRDLRQGLVDLARYLADLGRRGEAATGRPAAELVTEALSLVEATTEPSPARTEPPERIGTILQLVPR